jgi:predicted nuclease with TOPRIM domain
MKDVLQQRLVTLKAEFEKGQEKLHEIQMQEMQLKETLLRISGAIQVLTELSEQEEPNAVV